MTEVSKIMEPFKLVNFQGAGELLVPLGVSFDRVVLGKFCLTLKLD